MPQKIAMAGQQIPLFHKLRAACQIFNEHRRGAWGALDYYERFRDMSNILTQYTGKSVAGSRILEIGCGQRAVMPMLFAAHGANAFGNDVEVPTYCLNFATLLTMFRVNGAERALKSLTRHILLDGKFFKDLKRTCGLTSLPYSKVQIRVLDAATIDLPDDYFDLLFSFAVLEHVADVESAVHHMSRMLKPEGVGVAFIHLFPSLSGGHCLDWWHADSSPSKVVPAWDHLNQNRYPVNVFLNRLKLNEYRDIFARQTEVIQESTSKEGEILLSMAPAHLLGQYTYEDLTTSGVRFVFLKKGATMHKR